MHWSSRCRRRRASSNLSTILFGPSSTAYCQKAFPTRWYWQEGSGPTLFFCIFGPSRACLVTFSELHNYTIFQVNPMFFLRTLSAKKPKAFSLGDFIIATQTKFLLKMMFTTASIYRDLILRQKTKEWFNIFAAYFQKRANPRNTDCTIERSLPLWKLRGLEGFLNCPQMIQADRSRSNL